MRNRTAVYKYHFDGFGNGGATGGHLIPDYKIVVEKGFKHLYEKAKTTYEKLSEQEKQGPKGQELRAMMISAETPRKLALKYAEECRRIEASASTDERKHELPSSLMGLTAESKSL